MKRITFYNLQTGAITRRAMLDESIIEANLYAGEGYVDGWHDRETHMVVAGEVAHRPADDIEAEVLAQAWSNLRMDRNAKLTSSDWTQVPDAPVDHAAWASYRQALRDLPANTTDPRNPAWPIPPA